MDGLDVSKHPGTTAISTVAVRSGQTNIVIALLKYKDWLELKVVEVTPSLTHLGESYQEAQALKLAHDEVITKIRSKTSPVDELYRRAGELMAKDCKPEVYAAMADSLSLVWDSVNSHLEQRKLILQLNCEYFRYAESFKEKCDCMERVCRGELPVEISEMRDALTRLKELNRDILVLLSNALCQGNHLLEVISDICDKGTLDSRPAQIKVQAQHAKLCVEKWLESLHVRRRELALLAEVRSTQLSQCLALALITADLTLLRRHLVERQESLSDDRLGDAHASSQLLLHEHRKLMPEAKELQDQALKIVKATEELVGGGHFAGPEATAQAYSLLEMAASYVHQLDSVEALLIRAVEFFNEAQSALVKLDQLELQLGTGEVGLNEDQLSQLHATIAKSLEDVTSKPLQLGYNILQDQPGAQGVRATVEQIENKKISLSVRCTAHKEESLKANRSYNNFIDKYNQLNAFLSSLEAYLSGRFDFGSDLSSAKDFHQSHKVNSNDLQVKGSELNAVMLLVSTTCAAVDSNRAEKVESLADSLRDAYSHLANQLETRTRLSGVYMRAYSLGAELDAEMDGVEKVISSVDGDESAGNQAWFQIRQLEAQLSNTGSNFSKDIKASVLKPAVDSDSAIANLEKLIQRLEARRKYLDEAWTRWLDNKAQTVRNRANWERIMAQSNQTVDWVSKLDSQLYPVLNKDTHSARQLASHIEHKINTVLPEIRRAQQEIQLRIDTAEELLAKGDVKGNEGIPLRLKELSVRLQTIATEYQVLLEKLLTFFSSMSQLESKIESIQMDQKSHAPIQSLPEAERNQREFEATRHAVSEMMNMCLIESGHVINKIRSQARNSEQDVSTIERAVESLRYEWQRVQNERERTLERDIQRCQFDNDLSQINNSIDLLAKKLQDSRGKHGESLHAALEAQSAFKNFQLTIELLDNKIQDFIKSGENMLMGSIGLHVERELASLQRKWQQLKQQILETSSIIEMTVKYFTLVEQAKQWFQEGNRLLVTIIQESTTVKTVEEVTILLERINMFLKPGEERQQQRIHEISLLADKLQARGSCPQFSEVQNESKEIMDSFTRVSSELKILRDKLDKPSHPMEVDVDKQQVINIPIQVQSTPQTSSSLSSEFRSSTVVHKIEVHQEQVISSGQRDLTPPIKKVKYVEDERKQEAPYFVEPLHSITLQEGTKLKLECRLTGYPVPEVMWEKEGLSIETYPDYITKFDNGLCTLTIEETFTEDSAIFTCRAVNSAGSSETSAKVIVKEKEREDEVFPPIFVSPLSDIAIKEGEKLELMCQIAGFPLPTAQWLHKNRCLDTDPEFSVIFNNGVARASKTCAKVSDQGIYTCTASNPHGTQTSTAAVIVKKEEPAYEMPKFTTHLERVMARAGQKIKLDCEATGVPPPELTWTQDGKPIKQSMDVKVVVEGSRASLLIAEAFPRHAGVYRVTAVNPAGSVSTEAQVAVKGRPPEAEDMPADVEPTKPAIHLPLKDLSVFEGKKVRLDCVIVGQPEPEVIWYHNERPVKEAADIQLLFHGDRCSLIIKEAFLDDAGQYRVVAINSAGEISSSCNLTVQAVDRSTEGASRQPVTPPPAESSESLPFFTKLLTDVLAVQGETVTFECTVGGSPLPTVAWIHNNNDLDQSERVHMTQDSEGNCRLRISEVIGEDRGVYTARASNQQGEAKCFSHLNVKSAANVEPQVQPAVQIEDKHVPPTFSELFADRTVPEGVSTKFECIVTGKPTPKVRWLFNDNPVSGKEFLVSTSGNRQVLHIPSATKPLSGKISCVAENEAGKVTCTAQLEVSESLTTFMPSLDTITSKVQHESSVFEMKKSVFSHSSMSSEFSSTGSQPHVEVKSVTSQSEMSAHKIGDQPVSKVESHKTSEYSNVDGVESKHESQMMSKSGETVKTETVVSQPVKMIKPQRKSMPPRFMTPLTGCIVDQGADVTLEAILDGYPTPSVSWSKNGGPLSDGADTVWKLNRATLKLTNVSTKDAARYSITASNEAGTAQSTADVVVKKSSFPPVMGRRLQANTAVLGERVSMEIEVTGTPTPTITWSKDGVPVTQATPEFRLISQGNCHKLVIDNAEHKHSGKYSVSATNAAGEAVSSADLLIVEPTQPISVTTSEHVIQTSQERSLFGDSQFKPTITSFKEPGKDAVSVSETFSSERHVSMKVHHGSSGFESFTTMPESRVAEPIAEELQMPVATVTQEEKVEMKESKASALDFFKSMIKESEEKKTSAISELITTPKVWTPSIDISSKVELVEKQTKPLSPEFHLEPGPPPEMGFIPKDDSPKPKDDAVTFRVKKLQESYRDLQESEIPSGGVKMYPMPLKKEAPTVEYVDRVIFPERKKSIQMDFSHKKEIVEESVIPQKVNLPGMSESSFSTLKFEPKPNVYAHVSAPEPVLRPAADIPVRPLSPRPSAEGIGMEKLWSTMQKEQTHQKFESFSKEEKSYSSTQSFDSQQTWSPIPQTLSRPNMPTAASPSKEALSMEKKWGHKHAESKLKTVWPPPINFFDLPNEEVTESSSSKTETKSSSTFESTSKSSVEYSSQPPSSFAPIFEPKVEMKSPQPPQPTIYYVAEARATHRATTPVTEITRTSQTFSSSSSSETMRKESTHSQDRNILPSEAKKIWPKGPPITFETRGFSKLESKYGAKRSNSMQELQMNDILIEPGPPPEIGYASPTPKERRQSYVESIEHDLEKDLEREPSRHLAGAVRIIPPPLKKEHSVEREIISASIQQKKYQRTNSLDEFKRFPELEPFPFKVDSTAPQQERKFSTVPRPSTFVRKPYSESDYESDFESRIKARWTPWDSDLEEPTFRSVKPPEAGPRRPHSTEPEPIPPSKFDRGPLTIRSVSSCATDKQFRRVESETKSKPIKFEIPKQQLNGISQKPASPPKKSDSPKMKKKIPFHESGYMADTDEPGRFTKETKTTLQQSSQWRSETSKIEKKVHSSKFEKETEMKQSFPYQPEPVKQIKKPSVPPASPSKFVKGEFRESDYESDYESRIKSMWRPSSAEPKDPTFRPVKPVLRTEHRDEQKKEKLPTPPTEFDKPPSFDSLRPKFEPVKGPIRPEPIFGIKPGSPPKMDFARPPGAVETSSSVSFAESTANSRRVVSMQQTTRVISYDQSKQTSSKQFGPSKFVHKGDAKWASTTDSESESTRKDLSGVEKKAEEMRLQRVEEMRKRFGEKSSSQNVVELKPEEPPVFDYAHPKIPVAASNIANKHISEMSSSFKSKTQEFASNIMKDMKKQETLKEVKEVPKDAPQVYREEKRLSEKGSKHIDPDSGLIYFKYDFGYEFGVVTPGPGSRVKGITQEGNKEGSIEVPVIHETSTGKLPVPGTKFSTKLGWTSESETDDYSKPRITLAGTQSPHSIPSPCISPYTPYTQDSSSVVSGKWTDVSPRNLASSPVVVNSMHHSELPKKPPAFITPLRDIAVVSGQGARFECIVQAEPSPSVLWTRDGRVIEPSLTHELLFRNGVCRLTILNAFSADQGTYKCTATNELGSAETSSSLKVSGEARTYLD